MRIFALPLALLAFAVPPAAATVPERVGGCSWTIPTSQLPVHNWGAAGTRTVEVDLEIAFTEPVAAGVSCLLLVNGVVRDVMGPVPVFGAGAGAKVTTVTTTSPADILGYCMAIDYAGSTPDVYECYDVELSQIPPHAFFDLADIILDEAEPACPYVGDVYVGYEWVYDCDGPE